MSDMPTALVQLIDSVKHRDGLHADMDIVRRAEARHQKLTRSDLANFRRIGMPLINPSKVVALAEGLRVPPYRVVTAVLADHGVTFPDDARTPEAAIEHDPTLSSRLREQLLLLIGREREEQ